MRFGLPRSKSILNSGSFLTDSELSDPMWRVPIGCNSNRPPQEAVGGYNKEARGEKTRDSFQGSVEEDCKGGITARSPRVGKGSLRDVEKTV